MIKKLVLGISGILLFLNMLIPWFCLSLPAAAAEQLWSKLPIPTSTIPTATTPGYILAPDLDGIECMDISCDGTSVYAAVSISGHSKLLKSVDFGRSWYNLNNFPDIDLLNSPKRIGILDIVCSSIEANTLFATDGYEIYKSIDGGNNWVSLANVFITLGLTPGLSGDGYIVSLDLGYSNNSAFLFAATSTYGVGRKGHALVFQEANYFAPWSDMDVENNRDKPLSGEIDVIDIKCASDFDSTQTVLAVVTDYNFDYTANNIASYSGSSTGPATFLTTKPSTSGWASTAGDVALTFTQGQSKYAVDCTLYDASIWLPSDFSLETGVNNAMALVGVNPVIVPGEWMCGDVYLCNFLPADYSGIPSQSIDLDIGGTGTSSYISDLKGTGTLSNPRIIASGCLYGESDTTVWTSGNIGNNWTESAKAPTGGISVFDIPEESNVHSSCLCLKPDYITSGRALVGTQGDDCGVSLTADYGTNWHTVSLVRTRIDNIEAFAVQADGPVYISTTKSGDFYSLWRFNSGYWERILSESLFDGDISWNFLDIPSNGDTVFIGDGNTGKIWYSSDEGTCWQLQPTVNPSDSITGWSIGGQDSILIAGNTADEVYYSTSNGILWQAQTITGIGRICSVAIAPNGNFLAGGIAGGEARVARSVDNGITWNTVATKIPFDTPENLMVGFSYDYLESGRIVVTGTDGNGYADVWSWNFNVPTDWLQRDASIYGSGNPQVRQANGMVITAGGPGNSEEGSGVIYITDSSSGDGVSRIRGKNNVAELMAAPAGITFSGLWCASTDNTEMQLFTIGSDNNIYTYTDHLNSSGGAYYNNLTDTSVDIHWEENPGASRYMVFVTTDTPVTDIYTAQDAAFTGYKISFTAENLQPDTQYFVSIWAVAPVTSFQYISLVFVTPPAIPTYSTHFSPNHGAYNVPVDINFAWDAPEDVTVMGYTLEYGTDPDFTSSLKIELEDTQTYYAPREALEYSTTYYWRVATIGAGGESVFIASVFTTEALPQPITAAIDPPTLPPITLVIPSQTVTPTTMTVTAPKTTASVPTLVLPEEKTPMVMWILVSLVAGSSIITPLLLIAAVRSRKN